VCASREHSIILTATGHVWTFGLGKHGRLGHGSMESCALPMRIDSLAASGVRIVEVASTAAHTVLRSDTGKLYAFGRGTEGQLGSEIWDVDVCQSATLVTGDVEGMYISHATECKQDETAEAAVKGISPVTTGFLHQNAENGDPQGLRQECTPAESEQMLLALVCKMGEPERHERTRKLHAQINNHVQPHCDLIADTAISRNEEDV